MSLGESSSLSFSTSQGGGWWAPAGAWRGPAAPRSHALRWEVPSGVRRTTPAWPELGPPRDPRAHHGLISLHNTTHAPLGCLQAGRGRGETPALRWDVARLNAGGDALRRCQGSVSNRPALWPQDTTFRTRSRTGHP